MHPRRLATLAFICILCLSTAPAEGPQEYLRIVGRSWILAPAVTRVGGAYRGVLINISLTVVVGGGTVYVSTTSLMEKDIQASAITAVRVACDILGIDYRKYDYFFKVEADAIVVGGPSAGAAITTLVFAVMGGAPINRSVMMTGMINPDGAIGPVGGIVEKAEAVAKAGGRVFLVPPGQSVVTKYETRRKKMGPFIVTYVQPVVVNLTEHARDRWGLEVREVHSIFDVIGEATGYQIKLKVPRDLRLSAAVRGKLREMAGILLSKAEEEYGRAEAYVSGSSLDTETREQLLVILRRNSLKYLESARNAEDAYDAASLAFASIVNSYWIELVAKLYAKEDIEEDVKFTEDYVQETLTRTEDLWRTACNATISFLVASSDRILDAERKLGEARAAWKEDVINSLYLLSYARWRAFSSRIWANLSSACTARFLNQSEAKGLAEYYLAQARSTWSYVSAVLQEMGFSHHSLEDALGEYQEAKELFRSGRYILAAISSVRSMVHSELAFSLAVTQTSGSRYAVDYARLIALINIGRAEEVSEPAVPVMLFRKAEREVDVENKILLFKLSSYYAKLSYDLLAQNVVARSAGIPPPQKKPGERHGGTPVQGGDEGEGKAAANLGGILKVVLLTVAAVILLLIFIAMLHKRGSRRPTLP